MLSTHSYSLLCNIIYIFKIDCNFFSTLGAAGGLFFRLNRPTAAAKRVYSTTHTRSTTPFSPCFPEVAVSKDYPVITVSSLQAWKNVTAWSLEPPAPPFNQCSAAWRTLKLKMKALDSWPKIQTPYRLLRWELLKLLLSSPAGTYTILLSQRAMIKGTAITGSTQRSQLGHRKT